jgi:hypothetical protein
LWLKADAGVTQSGGLVSQWNDQSASHNNLTATGADQPTFNASSINGLPGLTFGSGNRIASTTDVLTAGSDRSVIIVAKPADNTGGPLIAFRSSPTANFLDVWRDDATYVETYTDRSTKGAKSALATIPAAMVAEFYTTVGSLPTVVVNATTLTTVAESGDGKVTAETGVSGVVVGDYTTSGGTNWPGDVCEVLIYDHVLSGDDITAVRTYLEARYGIALGAP